MQSDEAAQIVQVRMDEPVRSVRDRFQMKFYADQNLGLTNSFDRLSFQVNFPNSGQVYSDLRLCMPLEFQFKDVYGAAVNNNLNIADKLDIKKCFQEIRLTINGVSLSMFPETDLSHADLCWRYADDEDLADTGSLLPMRVSNAGWDIADNYNEGFAKRAKEFRSRKNKLAAAVAAVNFEAG